MKNKILNWFKSFFKKKPKWAYVEPAISIPENGNYEVLTAQEILDRYGLLLSEREKQQLRNLIAKPESKPFNFSYHIKSLYLMSGISEATAQHYEWAMEAIQYANINKWYDIPKTQIERMNKEIFSVKSYYYFMRMLNNDNIEAVQFFKSCEENALNEINSRCGLFEKI